MCFYVRAFFEANDDCPSLHFLVFDSYVNSFLFVRKRKKIFSGAFSFFFFFLLINEMGLNKYFIIKIVSDGFFLKDKSRGLFEMSQMSLKATCLVRSQ